MRVGQGYDVHPLAAGESLILGGVEIDYHLGLAGHSDADVLIHALMDALLGAAGLGDIGIYFPPGREEWRGASSLLLLRLVMDKLKERGLEVVNADTLLVAEKPQLSPYFPEMKSRIQPLLEVDGGALNIKATTTEGLGFIGREEGIAARAVVLVNTKGR